MSEMRRAAKALVEHRAERFESRHPVEGSKRRLDAALARLPPSGFARYALRWSEEAGRAVLHVDFVPPPATRRALQAASLAMLALIAASGWALFSGSADPSLAYLIPLVTALAILALPFAVTAFGSQREAAEARIRKAIGVALTDDDISSDLTP